MNPNVLSKTALLAVCLAPLAAGGPWPGDSPTVRYRAQTHFEMEPERLGVPGIRSDASTVPVDATMTLDCTSKRHDDGTLLRCRASDPEVRWTIEDDQVSAWTTDTVKTLEHAEIHVHLDEDGHLTKVDLDSDESGPADDHFILAKTVVDRATAGFDLPIPDSWAKGRWEQHQTALVPSATPNAQVSQRIQHRTVPGAAVGNATIETHGEVAFLLQGNGDTVIDRHDQIEGELSARARWDIDEGRLIERTWQSKVGNGWYEQTGSLKLETAR